jgi:uncharacterized membrane protein YdfJ with MMPL/SSD domain
MGDPNRDDRFARSWRGDYGRPRRSARERIMPRWLAVLLAVAAILIVLAVLFPGLLPW